MSDDNGGICQIPGSYYWSYEAAKQAGDGWAGHPEPQKHLVLVTEEGIFPLGASISVFADETEVIRMQALSKLSEKEKKALGFK